MSNVLFQVLFLRLVSKMLSCIIQANPREIAKSLIALHYLTYASINSWELLTVPHQEVKIPVIF